VSRARITTALLAAWLIPGAGARPPPAAPAYAATAVPTDSAGFTLFGWLTPPADSANLDRIGQMSALGSASRAAGLARSGKVADNLARLDWAGAHGRAA
jgi:hypothetical protein